MEWIKKHKKSCTIFVIFILVILVLFCCLIFENLFFSKISIDGWISFLGGCIGAIIGAIATIAAISIEIEYNKAEKQKEDILSVRPYLYINKFFIENISKKCSIKLTIQNLGLQAACSIRIFQNNQDLPQPYTIYDSRCAIAASKEIELDIETDLYNTEYYFFKYYDIKGNLYIQEFRAVINESAGDKSLDHFNILEPKMIQTKKEREEKFPKQKI